MKRLYKILLVVLSISCVSVSASAQISGFWTVKANLDIDMGFDIGYIFAERFGLKVGMLSDTYHPKSDDGNVIDQYEKAMGKKYRLSYTGGPMVKVMDWMWLSATAGYGEYGVYGYSQEKDMYGIKGKVKGLEVGLQFNFILDDFVIQAGYATLPDGFSAGKPLHDITFGIGMTF